MSGSSDPLPRPYATQQSVVFARQILSGSLSIIEGSVKLASLAHDIVPEWYSDPDFLVFGVISSDTDHLPTGTVRSYWSASALAREDGNIANYELRARDDVQTACQNIIQRFGGQE
jgi:Protein of unknown function (DUF2489)